MVKITRKTWFFFGRGNKLSSPVYLCLGPDADDEAEMIMRVMFLATLVPLHSTLVSHSIGDLGRVSNLRRFEACKLVPITTYSIVQVNLFTSSTLSGT